LLTAEITDVVCLSASLRAISLVEQPDDLACQITEEALYVYYVAIARFKMYLGITDQT